MSPNDVFDKWFDIAKLVMVAGLTAWLSNLLANRSHVKKVWWERRADAYTKLIESLSDLIEYADVHLDREYGVRTFSKERLNDLNALWKEGSMRVRRASDTGLFLFSSEVTEALNQYKKDISPKKDEDIANAIEDHLSAAKRCLRIVVNRSVRDLKLK